MNMNLSRLVAIIVSMFLSLFVICCGSSDSDTANKEETPQVAPSSQNLPENAGRLSAFLKNGTYMTECINLDTVGLKLQIVINGNKVTTSQLIYTDVSCSNFYTLNKTEYDLQNVTDIEGKKKLDFSLTKAYLKISESLVASFNTSEFYGYNDWDAENFKDITNIDTNPYDEDEIYHTGDSEEITLEIVNYTSFKISEEGLGDPLCSYQE